MMNYPVDLVFSQSSLQDFSDCRRRFFYRYIQRLAWPAPLAEPIFEIETAVQRGARFHHIIHQHLCGCPSDRISAMLDDDPQLSSWWHDYLDFYRSLPLDEGTEKALIYAEHTLITGYNDQRILAKYDLLVIFPSGKVCIVDWKTGIPKPARNRHRNMAGRWQTDLYPWVFMRAGESLTGNTIQPDDIEMIYWFAEDPSVLQRFPFSRSQYQDVDERLANVIDQIMGLEEADFIKTSIEKKCLYCSYRSLCNRGSQAGTLGSDDEDVVEDTIQDVNFDFEQVEELPY